MDVQEAFRSLARMRASIEGDSNLKGMDGILEDLKYMKRTWLGISAVVADAEELEFRDEAAKSWLRELRDLAREIKGLVDLYDYQVTALQADVQEEEEDDNNDEKTVTKEEVKEEESCITSQLPSLAVSSSSLKRKNSEEDDIVRSSWKKKKKKKRRRKRQGDVDENFLRLSHSTDAASTCSHKRKVVESEEENEDGRNLPTVKLSNGVEKIREHFYDITNNKYVLRSLTEVGSRSRASCYDGPGSVDISAGKCKQEELMEMLLAEGADGVEVIAVVGGGAGKTALCKNIYDSFNKTPHFNLRVWVKVGEKFDALHVTNEILNYFARKRFSYKQLSRLHERLVKELQGKKLLLVMDDVQCQNLMKWETILAPFEYSDRGSKILITCTNEKVAWAARVDRLIQLNGLSEDDIAKPLLQGVCLVHHRLLQGTTDQEEEEETDQEEEEEVMEEEEEETDQEEEEEEMDEMVVKKLKDMQQQIRDMLPINPQIMEMMKQCIIYDEVFYGRRTWIENMEYVSERIEAFIDSRKPILNRDVNQLSQRFIELTSPAHEYPYDEDMEELKAMRLHIQDKLTDHAEGHWMWLDKMKYFSSKIKLMIKYLDHLKQKDVPRWPKHDFTVEFQDSFVSSVIKEEAEIFWGRSISDIEKKELVTDDMESMSLWIDSILNSTASHEITGEAKRVLDELNRDLRQNQENISEWENLRWRFYKMRQIQSLHPVLSHVDWNLFGFTKRQEVEMVKQVKKAMPEHIMDKLKDAQGEEQLQVFFQQALDLLSRYEHVQPTEILAITRLRVDLDMFQQQFFQTSIWKDACIQATGEAKLSSSGFSSRSKEAYSIIKEDTKIMLWQLDVITLAVEQEGWDTTAGWLHELREDLDQLLKSSSSSQYFDPGLLFCAIIVWGLLKGKIQMMEKQIESLLLFARKSSHCRRQEMDDIIKYLKDKQKWIKAALYDAEGEEIQSETHETWPSALRDLDYQAKDLIGLYDYEQVAKQVEPTSSLEKLSIFCQERTILHEIIDGKKKFENKFDEVAKNKTDMHVATVSLRSGDSDNHLYTHKPTGYLPLDRTKFVGREEKMKELKEELVGVHGGEGTSTEVIAVIGMGGVGKTTLCQHIYNHPDIRSNFHTNGWVHVGGNFDLLRVANDILTSLSNGNDKTTYTQFAQLQVKINECVRGKRVLLILDDVWTEVIADWERTRTLFNDAGNGSKILISTRHKRVAQSADATQFIRLDKLSNEDGWSLFKMHAFREHPPPEDLVGVGEAILAKCCGLPLAIKVVGSLLRREGDNEKNWKSLLNSNWCKFSMHEGDKENKEILGPLYLSYQHLPRHLKACFRFLSLFEKGGDIEFDHLYNLWLAHDLISDDNGSISMRQIAHKWIEELASRSIVDIIHNYEDYDDIDIDVHANDININVHDLINDIAQYVSGNEFCFLDGTKKGSEISLDGVRHLHVPRYLNVDDKLIDTRCDSLCTIVVKGEHPHFRQLIARARNMRLLNCSLSLLPENFSFARNLRVLNIEDSDCAVLPPTIYMLYNLRHVHISYSNIMNVSCRIGNLINLRHLDLSYNRNMLKMPESVSRLTALQYLNLGGCYSLEELPSGISNLKALQYLNLGYCYSLQELPCGISDLTNLRALDVSLTGIQYMPCGLSRLTKLTRLPCFPLWLQEEHASLKSLKAFKQLEGRLRVEVNIVGCVKEEHAQEIEMSDSRQLTHLSIDFWDYMTEQSSKQHEQILQKLKPNMKITELNIYNYKGVKLPSWMGNRSFDKLVNIELDMLGKCTSLSPLHMLPSLEELRVSYMESLTVLLEVALEEENGGSSNTGNIKIQKKKKKKKKKATLETSSIRLSQNPNSIFRNLYALTSTNVVSSASVFMTTGFLL